ncbi:hypothetical protein TVNIR_2430 [Thioalkalivibrio nitratireducens DSM 14787]|uniref:Uncharacterized protein n=1 Tax=Thioalkalivibrio nitratireducens (strain DSM 14787 / UNIQEM 213 / ALEN2) TaxID=1255043 RepID=L0DYE3_THIND|nr:hypothetical protein [Thioalkalivibrio nitratireducens]AGA34073.1 hypothetical protein TVNIR_2430 [Thioalkalivibrio nitratireducens DSM 14787]
MSLNDDLNLEYDDDTVDIGAMQRPQTNPLAARRSLERLLEQRALRSRLRDDLDEGGALDDLDW